jgi:hypothetical protein
MRRNQLVFFLIIGIAAAIIGIGLLLQVIGNDEGGTDSGRISDRPPATTAPDIVIQVAASPLIETWVRSAAEAYNLTNPKVNGRGVSVQVTSQDSLDVWAESTSIWSPQNHPLVWIPNASYEVAYAEEVSLQYESYQPSLAQTPIIWGAYQSRAQVILDSYGDLNGGTVRQGASSERWEAIGGAAQWQFIKLAFARPNSSGHGLATLLMLVGESNGVPSLTAEMMNSTDVQEWLKPMIDAVPNYSTLGVDPAQVMATRGTSTAEIALLPESQWLAHYDQLNRVEAIRLFYSNTYMMLDFPYTIWRGAETDEDQLRAAQAFGDFLMGSEQQRRLGEAGFRPAIGGDLTRFTPFNAARDVIQVDLPGSQIAPADRASTLSLLRWFQNYRTAP